jgi:hypothetical protein
MASPIEGGRAPKGAPLGLPAEAGALNDAERVAFRRSTAAIYDLGTVLPAPDRGLSSHVIPAGFPAVHPAPSSH